MEKLITYSIVNDISANKLNLLGLQDEIIASGFITAFGSLSKAGDDVFIIGGSINDQEGLDNVLAVHTGEDLTRARDDAKRLVDKAAGRARARYTTDVSGQQATYLMKEQQCQAYKDAGYPADLTAYPFVQAELNALQAIAPSTTAQQAADTVLETAAGWIPLAAAIEELRMTHKNEVDSANSEANIENIRDAGILALDAI